MSIPRRYLQLSDVYLSIAYQKYYFNIYFKMRHIADHSINHVHAYILYGFFGEHIYSLKEP